MNKNFMWADQRLPNHISYILSFILVITDKTDILLRPSSLNISSTAHFSYKILAKTVKTSTFFLNISSTVLVNWMVLYKSPGQQLI